jgi:DnaA family protein
MRQLSLEVRLPDSARFSAFVAGSNAQLLKSLQATGPESPRVTWLWGRPGVGKTHLLQAACAAVGERGGTACYLDVADDGSPELLEGCEDLDLVCLDDLDQALGEPAWNAALFRLHTLMLDGGGRILIATTAPPGSLEFALPDLRSRLLAAAVHQLHALGDAELVEALRLRAARRGLELADDAAAYLLNRLPRDMHTLMRVLDGLDTASLAAQRRLTVPFLRQALEQLSFDPG